VGDSVVTLNRFIAWFCSGFAWLFFLEKQH
jgi:hypothetical protein